MIDALYLGVSGMSSQQKQIDAIAHNLTNMNTPGFKATRVQFHEVMNKAFAADATGAAGLQPAGVAAGALQFDFSQGSLQKTGSAADLAIDGVGFLKVTMPDGSVAYTRGGTLTTDENGVVVTQQGYPLEPRVQMPTNATSMKIYADGRVEAQFSDNSQPTEIARLELVRFARADALEGMGSGLFRSTEASGEAQSGAAGQEGMGVLAQGHLEGANVSMINEMTQLMLAQRAYEMSSKLVQTADELMGMTNNLRR
ncbi:Flagellar basal-body rod protein FlgG [Andreprevotia sp. IGB-42]|uniref:flagellar hook-basal body protein n=1 Tax=Andreprevotia sp. IGB-42 TaxID=2497473 RepID=UPI0013571FF3|nr:flagellar hook-basal body complex protein [Andreprevotia sp. IGB-42]KAF0813403.1 Flagellar basal-body rod protein FlgG [Andreprevotia sp. IGB-42]